MPFFLPSGTHTEQARIVLKFYKWMGKGLYFQNIQRKKIRKNNESSIEPPTAESYFVRVVGFSIAGHIYYYILLWYVGHAKLYPQHGSMNINAKYSIAHSHVWATGHIYAVLI